MSYTYHGTTGLIALPGRSMQTFPSGMIRVDRSYLCRKGLEANFREQFAVGKDLPLDDSTPAIDGLKIYPEVQEIYRDDGFVEFRASAYGRKNLDGRVEYRYRTGVAIATATVNSFQFNTQERRYIPVARTISNPIPGGLILRNAIVHRCIPIDEAPEEGRVLQGDVYFADDNQPISERVFSRTQLASEIFAGLYNSPFYIFRETAFGDSVQLGQSVRLGGVETKAFGSFQEIRETYSVRVGGIFLGLFNEIRVGVQASEITFERISEDLFASLTANFRKPLNSETFKIVINTAGRPDQILFDISGIGYGGASLQTGIFDLRMTTSAISNNQVLIRLQTSLPDLFDRLDVAIFAEGQNEQIVRLGETTWVI